MHSRVVRSHAVFRTEFLFFVMPLLGIRQSELVLDNSHGAAVARAHQHVVAGAIGDRQRDQALAHVVPGFHRDVDVRLLVLLRNFHFLLQ